MLTLPMYGRDESSAKMTGSKIALITRGEGLQACRQGPNSGKASGCRYGPMFETKLDLPRPHAPAAAYGHYDDGSRKSQEGALAWLEAKIRFGHGHMHRPASADAKITPSLPLRARFTKGFGSFCTGK